MSAAPWKFGDFELDVPGFQLRNGSGPVKLERIPLELLIFLIERRGQLVSREDIAGHIWRDGIHIDIESGVNTAIRKLRAALNDSPEKPAFIETVPGKGYRFIGPVVESERSPTMPTPPRNRRLRQLAALIAGVAAVLVTAHYAGPHLPRSVVPVSPVTVVVLPFQNLSSDREQDYFSEGLTEETIAALGRVTPSHIRVIGRTSSMAYKGTRKTTAQIGSKLGAGYLVESTVRRDAQRVRITTKLIRVHDQVQVWGQSYDLTPSGLLEVQRQIGTAIARRIGGQLAPRLDAARTFTQDPDAHDLYLHGRYYSSQRTPESIRKSVEYFEAALQKDPSYALAHAALADTYIIQALVTWANPRDHWKKAEIAIQKALSLDPNLAEAHTAAAMVSFFMAWDWPAAERSFRRAIELNPNYVIARQFYAHFLSNSKRPDEAVAEIEKAREIDPLSSMTHALAGGALVMARRYEEALQTLQQALAIDPDFFPTHSFLGLYTNRRVNQMLPSKSTGRLTAFPAATSCSWHTKVLCLAKPAAEQKRNRSSRP